MKTAVIFGVGGRLGKSLSQNLKDVKIVDVPKRIYREDFGAGHCLEEITGFLQSFDPTNTVVFVAVGLMNTQLSQKTLLSINLELPKLIIESCANLNMRCVTFGTVMETLPNRSNNYILSKSKLADFVNQKVSVGYKAMHIQMHTLYGGVEPTPYMFLGQIVSSIATNSVFSMTSGQQIREYHHVDDDVQAINILVKNFQAGIFQISHGRPIKLCELAEAIFSEFDRRQLLRLGFLSEPEQENYEFKFEVLPILRSVSFRSTVEDVIHYLTQHVKPYLKK